MIIWHFLSFTVCKINSSYSLKVPSCSTLEREDTGSHPAQYLNDNHTKKTTLYETFQRSLKQYYQAFAFCISMFCFSSGGVAAHTP